MEEAILFMSNGDGTFNCSWCDERKPNTEAMPDDNDDPICLSCYHGSVAEQLSPGCVLKFNGKRNRWLIRAHTKDRRYFIATNKVSNRVYYTIIDFKKEIRGPMNVIGGGLGIFSTSGPDTKIDDAIAMLEGTGPLGGQWEVSHRHQVALHVTEAVIYNSHGQ